MPDRTSDGFADRLIKAFEQSNGKGSLKALESLGRESGEPVAAVLLKLLTHLDVEESRAWHILRSVQKRREEFRRKLGRDPGPRVVLFDIIVSEERLIRSPKLVDMAVFDGIERDAITDHLTGIHNRSYFEERLQVEIRRARRYGQHLSLLLLDLDDFKRINDTRGHLVGDAVLREMGSLIREGVRDVDIAARYGGEEFAVILPETRRRGALIVAERIRLETVRQFRRKGNFQAALKLTISGGLAAYPEDAEDPSALLARADMALYRAKDEGKDLISVYFEEKRCAERIPVGEKRMKAHLQGEIGTGPLRQSGRVKNISEGGLLVELNAPVPVGSELQVTFSLEPDQAFTFPSKVVRLEQEDAGGKRRRFEAGLRFERRSRSLQPALNRLARERIAAS